MPNKEAEMSESGAAKIHSNPPTKTTYQEIKDLCLATYKAEKDNPDDPYAAAEAIYDALTTLMDRLHELNYQTGSIGGKTLRYEDPQGRRDKRILPAHVHSMIETFRTTYAASSSLESSQALRDKILRMGARASNTPDRSTLNFWKMRSGRRSQVTRDVYKAFSDARDKHINEEHTANLTKSLFGK